MLKKLQNRLHESKGFTLVELIVVIAIMVILIALLVPNVVGYISSAQDTANLSAAKSIYNAANTAVVNGKASAGSYPSDAQLCNLLNGRPIGTTLDTTSASTNKLVTISTGTSANIYYNATTGVVSSVIVGTVAANSTGVTADNASATNKAVYDPTKSGNSYSESWSAPTGTDIKTLKCINGGDWSNT